MIDHGLADLTEEERKFLQHVIIGTHMKVLDNLGKSIDYQLHDQVKEYRKQLRLVKSLAKKAGVRL